MTGSEDSSSVFESLRFRHEWRESQARVLTGMRLHLADKRLHVVAAPGAGKTTLGLECFRLLGRPALVLSPTRTIRDQWTSRLRDFIEDDAPFPPSWASTSLDSPGLLTSVTYQALHTKHRLSAADADADADEPDDVVDELESTGSTAIAAPNSEEISAVVALVAAAGIGTLILDEAHHLRAEWWVALQKVVDAIDDLVVVSLTGTPPYDAIPLEWARYEELCGAIDEEISVPELVKAGTLCPHQDYVWTVVPLESESQVIADYATSVEATIESLRADTTFRDALADHPWLASGSDPDAVLEDLPLAFSLHCLAASLDIRPLEHLTSALEIDDEQAAGPTVSDWQRVVAEYLFGRRWPDPATHDEHRRALASHLRFEGLLSGRELRLSASRLVKRQLTQSSAKVDACVSIHEVERRNRGRDLRLVVLTDFIRDDSLKEPTADHPATLGAVPIFRALLGASSAADIADVALLTGRVCMVHETRVDALEASIGGDGVSFEQVPAIESFVRVIAPTNRLTTGLTHLLESGDVRVLVGTRALLGEGWDAPCVNALVLASSVGSFMLTNQMRGRAIRTHQAHPDKVASIWHIVAFALDRRAGDLAKALWPGEIYEPGLADYHDLTLRFRTFPGLDEAAGTITTGLDRLRLPYSEHKRDRVTGEHGRRLDEDHFTARSALERSNEEMVVRREEIERVAEGWSRAVAGAEYGRMVPEIAAAGAPRIAGYHLKHTLAYLVGVAALLFWTVLLSGGGGNASASQRGLTTLLLLAALAASWPLAKAARLWLLHLPVDGSVLQIGRALLDALCAADIVQTSIRQLEVRTDAAPDGSVFIHLDGGTFYERSLFADAIGELLGEVDNPRYLLVREGRNPLGRKVVDYHSVPLVLGVRRERADLLLESWQRRVSPSLLVYTRAAESKSTLRAARTKSFASASRRATRRLDRWV